MRCRSVVALSVLALAACVDDPLLAPTVSADVGIESPSRVWFVGTPEITAARALVESVLAGPTDDLLLIVDGTIMRSTVVDRDLVRRAELIRDVTPCALYGTGRRVSVLIVVTAASETRPPAGS